MMNFIMNLISSIHHKCERKKHHLSTLFLQKKKKKPHCTLHHLINNLFLEFLSLMWKKKKRYKKVVL